MAWPDSVRRHSAVIGAGLCPGPDALASAGHLSFRRSVWRDGTSPAGDDPCLWRSRFVRALQMALYSGATVPSRSLYGLLLVGPQGNFARCFFLGCLARPNANLWVLPHLRCESRNLRRAHTPARFRNVCNLVRHGGSTFTIPPERYARHVLHVWRTVHRAVGYSTRPTADSFCGHHGLGPPSAAFRSPVDHRQAT